MSHLCYDFKDSMIRILIPRLSYPKTFHIPILSFKPGRIVDDPYRDTNNLDHTGHFGPQ